MSTTTQTARIPADKVLWVCSACDNREPIGQMFETVDGSWDIYCSACAEPGDDYLD